MRIFFIKQMCIVFTLCLQSASATDLYVMKSNRSWDYEKPPCKIATPDLVYTGDGPTVIIPPNVNIPDDERVVVGHTRTFEVFQYIGCTRWYLTPDKVVHHVIQSDPGQCYSVCQTTYIGLSDGSCYCLSEGPGDHYDMYDECSRACVHPANTACGGSGAVYYYISLYKHVETSSKVSDDGKYCRMYHKWTSTYRWQYCNIKLHGLCETGMEYGQTKYRHWWYQYPNVCFRNSMYPATENRIKIPHVQLSGDRWIGKIKSQTIVSISNGELGDFKYGYYGYISKRDNQFFLEFTKETSDTVLCIQNDDTTSTSLQTLTPTTTATTKLATTTAAIAISSSLFPNSTMSSITSTSSSEQMSTEGNGTVVTPNHLDRHEQDENGSSVIVTVCVVVSAVVLLTVAVIVVLIVRRKRKRNELKGNQKVLYSNGTLSQPSHADAKGLTNATYTNEFVPNTIAPRENANYILEDQYENSAILGNTDGTTNRARVSETSCVYEETVDFTEFSNQADNYFVLEKPIESSNKHEMNTPDNIDDSYDTANAFKPISTTPNGNIYNTMSEFAEDTYTYAGKENRKFHDLANPSVTGQTTDNTYSHLSNDGETDNVYNTAGEGNHQHQIDDTYNHI